MSCDITSPTAPPPLRLDNVLTKSLICLPCLKVDTSLDISQTALPILSPANIPASTLSAFPTLSIPLFISSQVT